MQCKNDVSYQTILNYLDGLSIGPVTHLVIKNCPVPEETFKEFIQQKLGIPLSKERDDGGLIWFEFVNSQGTVQPFHLQNLTGLRSLDLRGSLRGQQIEKTHLLDLHGLARLDLSGNRGLELLPGALTNLSTLRYLQLSGCDIKSLDVDTFTNLTNLTSLHLNSNKLTDLPAQLFRDLGSLETLFINKNLLGSLPKGILDSLTSLTEIDMGFNRFSVLPEDLFAETTSLAKLVFVTNFDYCPQGPEQCSQSARRIDLPSTFFQVPSLTSVKMLHVPINGLPPQVFEGAKNLVNITIQSCYFSFIPPGTFKDCASLEKLDLSGNTISNLTDGVFSGLGELKNLRLRLNKITEISRNVLDPLVNLEILHLQENNITEVHRDSLYFLKNLVELNMSKNNLVYPGRGKTNSWFLSPHTFSNLVLLDLSHNKFSAIEDNVLNNFLKLKELNLSYNNFSQLHIVDLNLLSSTVVDLNLSHNQITRILLKPSQAATLMFGNLTEPKFSLDVGDNPLICDCFINEFRQMIGGDLDSVFKNVFTLKNKNNIRCGANSPGFPGMKLEDVKSDELTCIFPSRALDAECPGPCDCSWNRQNHIIRVNCMNKGMTRFPPFLPRILTNAETENKIELHLENNNIVNLSLAVDHFYKQKSSNYSNIQALYLTNNAIQEFSQECLPPNLKLLHLDGNQLTHLDKSSINFFSRLVEKSNDVELRLGNNPYSCSCDSQDLFRFIRSLKESLRVADRGRVFLACSGEENKPLLDSTVSDFCLFFSPEIIAIIFLIVVFLGSLILLLLFYSCYKDTIQIWLYSQGCLRCLFTDELKDSDKPYDVFISYSHHDSEFVQQVLLPGLESSEDSKYKYKCLTHEKDWLVGEDIPANIINSVQSSRRTLIVLSKDFITSMWSNMEFRAAHTQALQDKTQRVVIVLLGELPEEHKMEEDLKRYISLNTYIQTENPWFWQRLRYALPHRGTRPKKRRTRRETDQLELMRAQAEAEMGKGSRTPSPPNVCQTSPPTVSMVVSSDKLKNKNAFVNGHTNGSVNGNGSMSVSVNGLANGHTKVNDGVNQEAVDAYINDLSGVRSTRSKDQLTEEYLRRVVPQHASNGGRLVRDIMVANS